MASLKEMDMDIRSLGRTCQSSPKGGRNFVMAAKTTNEKTTICLDFGTSSIRAAVLDANGLPKVLPIGQATGSELDDVSIRSDVLVEPIGARIHLAENALRNRSNGSLFYEPSPKLWLDEPDRLDTCVVNEVPLTREVILTLLLAHALSACIDTVKLAANQRNNLEVCISHPIWDKCREAAIISKLSVITEAAKRLCSIQEISATIGTQLISLACKTLSDTKDGNVGGKVANIDTVIEPIAATTALLPQYNNVSRLCAVVDIGAGTTDIAIFIAHYPDSVSKKPKRVIPIGEPTSIFKAGNYIDQALLSLIRDKAANATEADLQELGRRIRQVKETLFRNGSIREPAKNSVSITLEEFSKLKAIDEFSEQIHDVVSKQFRNKDTEPYLFFTKCRGINHVDLIIGGGGARLPFVVEKLQNAKVTIGGENFPLRICDEKNWNRIELFKASIARLAVVIGGVQPGYKLLQKEFTQPIGEQRAAM